MGSDLAMEHLDQAAPRGRRGDSPFVLFVFFAAKLRCIGDGRVVGMATKDARDTKGSRCGRPGLRPRPGSMAESDACSGGFASLNHRLQAGIPPGWIVERPCHLGCAA